MYLIFKPGPRPDMKEESPDNKMVAAVRAAVTVFM
jgi:hypothetical protein